jgi:hypothetical protein
MPSSELGVKGLIVRYLLAMSAASPPPGLLFRPRVSVSGPPPGLPPIAAAPSKAAKRRGRLALCARLSVRGPLAWISLGIGALTVFGAIVVTLSVARQGANAPLASVPSVTSSALAWGAGALFAFAAAAKALRRDKEEGIRALLLARGGSTEAYALARVAGLALVLSLVLAGGTAAAGIVAALAAAKLGLAASALQATLASMAYALAFALVLAPVAVAALGARSRGGGYGRLLVVLVLPELFERWTARALPGAWRELVSIPSALGALRAALMPPGVDVARFFRAALVLAIVVAVAMLVVRREARRIGEEAAS